MAGVFGTLLDSPQCSEASNELLVWDAIIHVFEAMNAPRSGDWDLSHIEQGPGWPAGGRWHRKLSQDLLTPGSHPKVHWLVSLCRTSSTETWWPCNVQRRSTSNPQCQDWGGRRTGAPIEAVERLHAWQGNSVCQSWPYLLGAEGKWDEMQREY